MNAADLSGTTSLTEVTKMEVDYSSTCDQKIPEAEALAKKNLQEALDMLIALEKQTRIGGDMISTGRILVSVVRLCFEAKDYERLKENINLLSRRRGQLKQAVVKMVQEVCTYVDKLPTKDLQYQLIETLRSVTEGKIYVEVERARLTYKLAKMKEEEGKIQEAAGILQELQVETYGSMEKREKVELILEQMRFCLAIKDYIRTQIISKKISTKYFEDESTHDLKILYYTRMIEMDQHEDNYLSICRHYRAMLATPRVQENSELKKEHLRSAVLYLVLSPYTNEQADLLHRMLEEKALESIPKYKSLLELFKNQEIIQWRVLCAGYEQELRTQAVFSATEQGERRWKHLKDRVVEHNIRIMAKYYIKIHLKRMSELLELQSKEVEEVLCSMVVAGSVTAKVDRPEGVVYFQALKDPNELLNDWSQNLNSLMNLIARTTHLINKEEMVHKHLLVASNTALTSNKDA
jgi:26S proteasome regulatory subunit N5